MCYTVLISCLSGVLITALLLLKFHGLLLMIFLRLLSTNFGVGFRGVDALVLPPFVHLPCRYSLCCLRPLHYLLVRHHVCYPVILPSLVDVIELLRMTVAVDPPHILFSCSQLGQTTFPDPDRCPSLTTFQ